MDWWEQPTTDLLPLLRKNPGLTVEIIDTLGYQAVLRFNQASIGAKWDVLSRRMGGAPDAVIAALNARIGMPAGLRAMGVTDAMMEAVSHAALKDHCHATNPRIATQQEYLGILREAA